MQDPTYDSEPQIGRVTRTGTYWTEDGPETGTVESFPADSGNPEWWERAIAGECSHGGHGWDGETCDDAPDRRMEHIIWLSGGDGDTTEDECCTVRPCDECGAPTGRQCEIWCIADQAPRPAGGES